MRARELDLYEYVATIAGKMPAELFSEPDDDWMPIAFLEGREGEASATMPLGDFMGSDREKDILANMILPSAIKHFKAVSVVMVLSTWVAGVANEDEYKSEHFVRPSERPDRQEKLLLMELTPKGPGRHSWADILRHEKTPPTLSGWEVLEGESIGFDGRFVGPLVNALKEVAA